MAQRNAHRVLAVYPDMETARGALRTLEGRGIDADEIKLLGGPVEHASRAHDVSGRDRNVAAFVGRRAAIGGIVGALVGLILGLVVGAIANGPMAVYVIVGIVFLGGFGFAFGGYASLGTEEEWELTFQPDEFGQVAVGVETTDQSELDKAAKALEQTHPIKVERA